MSTEQTSYPTEPESPFRPRPPLEDDRALNALTHGHLTVLGQMPWSSNATCLVDISYGDLFIQGVYKPAQGERPLHDFPHGIYRREVAAWELTKQLGWGLIPPTVLRDGPHGEGSVQLYIPCDYAQHFFTLRENPAHHSALQRLAAFDLVSNNTDRKGGHVLAGDDEKIWAIDNALSFHQQFKVRTVIWDWAGQPLSEELLNDLWRLVSDGPSPALAALLDPFETDALITRSRALATNGCLPHDTGGRSVPWPLL